MTKNIEQRLMDYSELDPSGCRLWTKNTVRGGYGQVSYRGKQVLAHRLSYEISVGPIPEGLCVLHRCHTPACINPDHLRVGTHQDNSNDMVRAGRSPSGEKSGRAKLTHGQVQSIRQKHSEGGYSLAALGVLFGVSKTQISYIVRGKSWKEDACSTL